jgi:hypothetical protein
MAVQKPTKHSIDNTDSTLTPAYKYTDTAGDWILIPKCQKIIATIDATSGSSKLQVTNDIDNVNAAGTVAGIIDWDEGVISSAIAGVEIAPVMAVRQVISAGTATLYLRVV